MQYSIVNIASLIVSASATIVAIIGGFIASKLISLSTERNELTLKLLGINNEIDFRTKEIEKEQKKLNDEDAVSFIRDNISDLINRKGLDDVYNKSSEKRLSYDELERYWNDGLSILDLLSDFSDNPEDDFSVNDDGIPVDIVKELHEHYKYRICKLIIKQIENGGAAFLMHEIMMPVGNWYLKSKDSVYENKSKITWLKVQKKSLLLKEQSLSKPKGMLIGLLLLIFFQLQGL